MHLGPGSLSESYGVVSFIAWIAMAAFTWHKASPANHTQVCEMELQ